MRCLIFAAGLGSRLKPITDTLPKALVPVCNKTLLEHLLLKLKAAGFNEVVINVHHFAHLIKDFIASKDNFGMKILFSDETDMLRETGGGIKHAEFLLDDGEPFLVHNVDIFSNLDLEEFYQAHISASISVDTPLATLLVSDRVTSRYFLFDKGLNLVGWVNLSTGEVKSPYSELKCAPSSNFNIDEYLAKNNLAKYAFAGTHVISPAVFPLMAESAQKFSIVDFYLSLADKYNIKGYIKSDLELVDVGKLETLQLAEEFILSKNNH